MLISDKRILFHALSISFFAHLFILGLFIFSFSLKPQREKPVMTFLGSILRGQDLIISQKMTKQAGPAIINHIPKNLSVSAEFEPLLQSSGQDKSLHIPAISQSSKKDQKTLFEISEIKKEQKDQGQNINIEPSIPPRQPLKINP
ncbi:MAG: hypothetical protein ABIJ41_00990 [Candidatus Omnitrophota bacterium]